LSPEEKEKKKKQKSAFWPQMTMSQRFLRDQKKLQLQDCYPISYQLSKKGYESLKRKLSLSVTISVT